MRAERGLREGYGEGGVGGEVEGGVALAPVSEIFGSAGPEHIGGQHYLMTAIFTGAVVLARYTFTSAIGALSDSGVSAKKRAGKCRQTKQTFGVIPPPPI